jgi:glycyl-tRNA synthetase
MNTNTMDKIVSLAKQRGFIFPSSEIYGGLNSCYDYGPLGVELKNNVKREWWKSMVQLREDIVGLDASILMHPKVWEASGHVESFTDPLVECKACHRRFRADHLLPHDNLQPGHMKEHPDTHKPETVCPECGGELTDPKSFNLLMETTLGAVEGEASKIYLRGETCQGIYVNFENVRESMRKKLPFGIAQIGKAFRNEITPGHLTYRTREFEQMEMQYFIHPSLSAEQMKFWKNQRMQWYLDLGMNKEKIRFRQHEEDERAHYAKDAWDIEYDTPFGGWKEMAGIHDRGNWDLSRHSEFSGKALDYFDEQTQERFIPHIVETSDGVDRAALMFLIDAYTEIEGGRTKTTESKKETEVVLKFHKKLAPIKIAILPLSKKQELQSKAHEVRDALALDYMTMYDETGSIGKRYRRQDEIGTPYCVTVDFESLDDKAVTIRDRDTMEQERVSIMELRDYFGDKFSQ